MKNSLGAIAASILSWNIAYSQELPPLPPIPPIGSIESGETDSPTESNFKANEPKEYIIPDRRESINGTYLDQDNNVKEIHGNDHIKYLDNPSTGQKNTCIVIGDILDCP